MGFIWITNSVRSGFNDPNVLTKSVVREKIMKEIRKICNSTANFYSQFLKPLFVCLIDASIDFTMVKSFQNIRQITRGQGSEFTVKPNAKL